MLKLNDGGVSLLKLVVHILLVYDVVRMGISFVHSDYNAMITRACSILFIVAVYTFTMHRLKKEEDNSK
ncbi:hypothetical protein NSQ20_11745 [Paenibacillus sp. FSL K6-1122]|uniref:hypothetical protein n=1 Tax=Paenibacillus sp. FSL K6-1122 TaxID=2954512 RepID=UPI0030EC65A1